MRQRLLPPAAALAALAAVGGLTACGSSGIGGGTDAGGGMMSIPTSAGGPPDTRPAVPSSAAEASSSAAAANNQADIHATGAVTISATGKAGSCDYYTPDTHTGVNYTVSSSELPSASGTAGTWKLQIVSTTGSDTTVTLTTGKGAFTSGTSTSGTVKADPKLTSATFDVQLTNPATQQHTQLKGSITCGASSS